MAALFAVLFVLAVGAGLVWLGYVVAQDIAREDREVVTQQRQALETEWQALDRARQVTDVYFAARRALQDELRRPGPSRPQL